MKKMHNCRIKRYPDGTTEIIAAAAPFGGGEIHREPTRFDGNMTPMDAAIEKSRFAERREEAYADMERDAIRDDGPDDVADAARRLAARQRSQRRARVTVRDLGLCNDWTYFVTLTLDRSKIDRYNAAAVIRRLNVWLDNRVRRDGLVYLLVPEHHKDGAIHFHGFFNAALPVVDSGHQDGAGHPVFNIPAWTWGFSTAIRLYGERAAAVGYCCKYIAKQQEKIGGRWYYSGGKLKRPTVEWTDADFESICGMEGAEVFSIGELPRSRFVRLRGENNKDLDRTKVL